MTSRPPVPARASYLTRGQIALAVVVGLLVLGLGALIITSYVNISATSSAFEMGYLLADLAETQRGVARLQVETIGNLYSRSMDTARAEMERRLLGEQIARTRQEAVGNAPVLAALATLESSLAEYDALLALLAAEPAPGNMLAMEPRFVALLTRIESQIKSTHDNEEASFFTSVSRALRAQRATQVVLLVSMFLVLAFGVALALSVRSRVNTQFERAYALLEQEVAVRQRAEEDQRRQTEYLSALHDTSVGLMNHLDVSDLLQTILERAVQLMRARDGYIFLTDRSGEALEMRFATGRFRPSLGHRMMRGEGLAGQVLAEGRALAVPDYRAWEGRSLQYDEADIHLLAGVPLTAGGAKTIGVLGVAPRVPPEEADGDAPMGEAEIDILSRFAQLASIAMDNAQLFAEAQDRMREVEALYRADADLYGHLNLDEVLRALVAVAVDVLQADKSLALVWDAAGERLAPRAAQGFAGETLEALAQAPTGGCLGEVIATKQAVVVEEAGGLADDHCAQIMAAEGIRSAIHVPVLLGGSVFGVFTMGYARPRHFGEEDRRLAEGLAQRAAAAIHNARLYEQAQLAATLEERQRLARELHDAVTQTLFSASLIAEVLPKVWEKNAEVGRQRLEELHVLTRGALAEMRSLLMELRPASLTESALPDLLRGLAEATEGRTRVPVHLDLSGECRAPAEVRVALYRIAQEALNNIAKHAAARNVWVRLECADGGVRLSVRDDGRGFAAAGERAPESLGLAIMRERAEGVGALLRVESAPGQGTTVHVGYPGQGALRSADPVDPVDPVGPAGPAGPAGIGEEPRVDV